MLVLICQPAISGEVTGKITKIEFAAQEFRTYSTNTVGVAFIFMDELPKACSGQSHDNRVAISTDHPLYTSVVSGSLAAKASGMDVRMLYVDECSVWNTAWDFSVMWIQ